MQIILAVIQYAAWPIVALIAIRLFEDDIKGLFARVEQYGGMKFKPQNTGKNIGDGGSLSSFGADLQEEEKRVLPQVPAGHGQVLSPASTGSETVEAIDSKSRMKALLPKVETAFLKERADYVRRQLEGLSVADQTEVLIKNVVAFRTTAEFEAIYSKIYGSQILMLQHLRKYGKSGDIKSMLLEMFHATIKIYPGFKNVPFEVYFSFLIDRHLVSEKNDRYFITDFGEEFLTYLGLSGYPTDKPF